VVRDGCEAKEVELVVTLSLRRAVQQQQQRSLLASMADVRSDDEQSEGEGAESKRESRGSE
jgi:hypothetical protein